MKESGIYQIKNNINGKIYIGSSSNLHGRKLQHFRNLECNRHPNDHLQLAYNKYGSINFKFEILHYCENEALLLLEQTEMGITECLDRSKGYNKAPTAGSSLGRVFSQETKDKIGKAGKGRVLSPETRGRMSKAQTGRKHSKETLILVDILLNI